MKDWMIAGLVACGAGAAGSLMAEVKPIRPKRRHKIESPERSRKPPKSKNADGKWTRFITASNVCFGFGLLLLSQDKTLLGVGFILAGLIFRLERQIHNHQRNDQKKVESNRTDDKVEEEPESFGLNLTRSSQAANSGWSNASVYPARHRYERQDCYGGPPVTENLWEYDIKEQCVVFHRLLDRYDVNFRGPEYEVVNGSVLEDVFEERSRERENWINSLPEEKREYYRSTSPYSAERMEELRREVTWREMHGAVKYFILSKHYSWGKWRKEVEKLRTCFSKIAAEAEALGAVLSEDGIFYDLPKDAEETQRQKLDDLFSEKTLLKKYDVRSWADWRDRDFIVKLLEDDPPSFGETVG
jgi:hypothetical protein